MPARNPKDRRIMVRVTIPVEEQIEKLADDLGLNKGTAARVALGIGLAVLRGVLARDDALAHLRDILPNEQ